MLIKKEGHTTINAACFPFWRTERENCGVYRDRRQDVALEMERK